MSDRLDLRCVKCGRWLTEIVGTYGRAKCCGWEIVVTHRDHDRPLTTNDAKPNTTRDSGQRA